MTTTSRFELPGNVVLFAAGLSDALERPRGFWINRTWQFDRVERFILTCMMERLNRRYLWSVSDFAAYMGRGHSMFFGPAWTWRRALWELYPDLHEAVVRLDGYQAGRYIPDHWGVAVRASCGFKDLRATG